jgi:hypothetical protein
VIDRYPVDGFFFNWFGFSEVDYEGRYRGVCHAESTRRAFRAETGLDTLPDGPDSEHYAVWRQFADGVVARLTGRIRDHIRDRRPDAGLILGRSADIRFHEANNAVGREYWHQATSEAVSALRTAAPTVPVLVNSVAFLDMPYRMAGEQPEAFVQYLTQTIARGGNPSIYVMGPPGAVPYPGVAAAAEVMRVHRDHSLLYDGLAPCAVTGLVRPARGEANRARYEETVAEFRGLFAALQERHVPFDVVPAEAIAAMAGAGLDRYRLLVVPDAGPLDADTARSLDEWVAAGGRLLATGATAIDAAGEVQLGCLPGERATAELAGPDVLRSTFVAAGPRHDDPAVPIGERAPVVPLHGRRHEMTWRRDAQPHLAVLGRAPFGPPELAYGNAPTGEPGYAVRRTGAGVAAQIPWSVGRAYRELGVTALRDLAVGVAVDLLDGAERLSADLPEQVEITVGRSGSATVVHLLNQTGVSRAGMLAPVTVHGGVLRIRNVDRPLLVRALVAGMECRVRTEVDGTATIAVPPLGQFEVLEVSEVPADS